MTEPDHKVGWSSYASEMAPTLVIKHYNCSFPDFFVIYSGAKHTPKFYIIRVIGGRVSDCPGDKLSLIHI